jgi:hypothetical protein
MKYHVFSADAKGVILALAKWVTPFGKRFDPAQTGFRPWACLVAKSLRPSSKINSRKMRRKGRLFQPAGGAKESVTGGGAVQRAGASEREESARVSKSVVWGCH